MQQLERIGNSSAAAETALRSAMRGWQAGLWTALPAILQKFSADAMTCEAQPAIKGRLTGKDGKASDVNLPLLVDCPVLFPSGGGFMLSLPLAKGDEGLVVFSSRCIDSWWQSGGVQTQAELRMHDLSDGFFLPGCFSKPRAPEGVSTDTAKLWKTDGSMFVELGAAGKITAKAPAEIVLDAPLVRCTHELVWAKGQLNNDGVVVTGSLNATNDIIAGHGGPSQVALLSHKHLGVNPGGGQSGPPVPNT